MAIEAEKGCDTLTCGPPNTLENERQPAEVPQSVLFLKTTQTYAKVLQIWAFTTSRTKAEILIRTDHAIGANQDKHSNSLSGLDMIFVDIAIENKTVSQQD